MINGDNIDIEADHVTVEAVYGAQTCIAAVDDVAVGLSRGDIKVWTNVNDCCCHLFDVIVLKSVLLTTSLVLPGP